MVHVGQMFWTPFGCVFGMQCQTDCLKRMLIPSVNSTGSTGWASIQKMKNLTAVKVSELRELSDWRLCVCVCVCEIRDPWQACLHERPQNHSALYGAEKYVFLFQFPASITDPTSQSWLDNKPLSHAHMHRLPRKFMIKIPANRVHEEKPSVLQADWMNHCRSWCFSQSKTDVCWALQWQWKSVLLLTDWWENLSWLLPNVGESLLANYFTELCATEWIFISDQTRRLYSRMLWWVAIELLCGCKKNLNGC